MLRIDKEEEAATKPPLILFLGPGAQKPGVFRFFSFHTVARGTERGRVVGIRPVAGQCPDLRANGNYLGR